MYVFLQTYDKPKNIPTKKKNKLPKSSLEPYNYLFFKNEFLFIVKFMILFAYPGQGLSRLSVRGIYSNVLFK